MRFLPLFFLVFLSSFLKSNAQQDSVSIPDPGTYAFSFHAYFCTPFSNYTFTNLGSIGYYLKSQSLQTSSFQFPFYFGGAYQWKRWKIGSDFIYSLPVYKQKNELGVSAQHRSVSLSSRIGYAFVYERNRVWFINIGIGTQTNYIDLEKSQQKQTIEMKDLFNPSLPGFSQSLFHTGTFCEISIEKTFRSKRTFSLSPVLRTGFRLGIEKLPWQATSAILKNAPIDRLHQIFLQAIFAISANKKTKAKTLAH